MKISFPKKEDGFNCNSCCFCGIDAFLITPQLDVKWTKDNLFYRSLIVDKNGVVLSSGWPKFFNYGEKTDCYESPTEFEDWEIQEKMDGTLVICDYVNGKFSLRTRGTASYALQKNFKDFEQLLEYHPNVKSFLKENSHLSLLFELVTPNNVIVLRPTHIQFYYLGAIDKNNLTIITSNIQQKLNVVTPKIYKFTKLLNAIEAVKFWKGQEGIVLSYNNNQNRIKIKSQWYCWIHKVKSQLNSDKALVQLYVKESMPDYKNFYKIIETSFDFEIAEQLKSNLQKVVSAGEFVSAKLKRVQQFVDEIKSLSSRKEQADMVTRAYQRTNPELVTIAFSYLDDKIKSSQIEKLIENQLRN